MELLWRERAAPRNDDLAIAPIDVGPLDGTIVQVGNTNVGPVDVTGFRIDDDSIGMDAVGDNDLSVGAVRVHQQYTAAAQIENE
jgi:hypothetical protein